MVQGSGLEMEVFLLCSGLAVLDGTWTGVGKSDCTVVLLVSGFGDIW